MSESLDTLDERWKAGSFRYLMPDFRARVHRGETFVVAGERFAIGSSREMSPAGLKAIAEEVGLQMVIICGANMGDIFRRNSFNLGLHVVQSSEAVADARDGDEFTFDPASREIVNVTQGKSYAPVPLSAKEDEIRQSGGIFAVGRREFRDACARRPKIVWPDAADRPRASAPPSRSSGRTASTRTRRWRPDRRCVSTPICCPPPTARRRSPSTPSTRSPAATASFRARRRWPTTTSCSPARTTTTSRPRSAGSSRAFHGMEKPYYANPGDGIFHFYFPEQGLVLPGQFIPGADSHSRAYGAYGAVGMGVGSTTLGFGWSTGYIYFTMARQRRVRFTGRLREWVTGKDIVLELLRRWGAKQSQGMSVELVDADRQLPMTFRNTIANMMAEAETLNGIFAPDETTYAWYRAKGMTDLPYPPIALRRRRGVRHRRGAAARRDHAR